MAGRSRGAAGGITWPLLADPRDRVDVASANSNASIAAQKEQKKGQYPLAKVETPELVRTLQRITIVLAAICISATIMFAASGSAAISDSPSGSNVSAHKTKSVEGNNTTDCDKSHRTRQCCALLHFEIGFPVGIAPPLVGELTSRVGILPADLLPTRAPDRLDRPPKKPISLG